MNNEDFHIGENKVSFLSDGIIITGKGTGIEADIEELAQVKENTDIPILIGSGITYDNVDNAIAQFND